MKQHKNVVKVILVTLASIVMIYATFVIVING
jgi:hypothetical protein